MLIRVQIVIDDPKLESRLDSIFEPLDIAIATAPQDAVLWDRVNAFPADLVVIGRSSLPEPITDTIETILALPEHPEIIVISDEENADERTRLLIAGCTAVLNSGLDDSVLRSALSAFVTRQRNTSIERLQNQVDVPSAPRLSDFESESAGMRSFLRVVDRVVEPDSSLLIQGETGVGKEWLARAIHAASPRASGPFIPVILSSFPESLVEGELFGYEKGAFTGAVNARRGCFEMAHGGTLMLDEIGELSRHLQVKLLSVLQDRVVRRLGSEELIPVNVRVMAATNRDLQEEIKARRFRRDLYYRLSVVTLDVPPLNQRSEDIPKLAARYLDEFRIRLKSKVTRFSDEAIEALIKYDWPGNIRELINVVERAVLLCESDQIRLNDLPRTIVPALQQVGSTFSSPLLDVLFDGQWQLRSWEDVRQAFLGSCEHAYFVRQLGETKGNIQKTAQRAGINPRSLYDLMKRHGLKKEDFRVGSA